MAVNTFTLEELLGKETWDKYKRLQVILSDLIELEKEIRRDHNLRLEIFKIDEDV